MHLQGTRGAEPWRAVLSLRASCRSSRRRRGRMVPCCAGRQRGIPPSRSACLQFWTAFLQCCCAVDVQGYKSGCGGITSKCRREDHPAGRAATIFGAAWFVDDASWCVSEPGSVIPNLARSLIFVNDAAFAGIRNRSHIFVSASVLVALGVSHERVFFDSLFTARHAELRDKTTLNN